MRANVDSRSMAGVPAVLLTYTFHAQLVSLLASFGDKMVVFLSYLNLNAWEKIAIWKKRFPEITCFYETVLHYKLFKRCVARVWCHELALKVQRPSCWNCRALSISMTNMGVSCETVRARKSTESGLLLIADWCQTSNLFLGTVGCLMYCWQHVLSEQGCSSWYVFAILFPC